MRIDALNLLDFRLDRGDDIVDAYLDIIGDAENCLDFDADQVLRVRLIDHF